MVKYMKRLYFGAIAAAMAMSCSQQEQIQPESPDFSGELVELSGTAEQTEPAVKTYMTSSNTVAWKETDELSVLSLGANDHLYVKEVNPSHPSQVTFKGKMTTGKGLYYALYPFGDDAAYDGTRIIFKLPQTQAYTENSFADGAFPSIAKFVSVSDHLRFRNICGVFRLTLKGDGLPVDKLVVADNDNMTLWGTASLAADDNLGTDFQKMTLSGGNNSLILDCSGSQVTLTPEGKDFYLVAPAGAFRKGFKVYVYSEGKVYSVLSTKVNNLISRSKVLAMPAIGAAVSSYDLSEGGTVTANCYIAPAAASYKFKATMGCGGEAVNPASVGILWESDGTVNAPAAGSIISEPVFTDGYIHFTTTGKKGNVVIAAFSGAGCTGTVIWNWHIWCAGESISVRELPVPDKVCMMDRNLGALGSRVEDGALAAGLLYQWGRKDPFTGAATVEAAGQKTTPPLRAGARFRDGFSFDSVDNAGGDYGNVAYSVAHPTTFISCANGFNDNDWLVGHDASLWVPEKTQYDPCPPGYRVPDKGRDWAWYSTAYTFNSKDRGYTLYGTEWFVESGYVYRVDGTFCGGYDAMFELWSCSADAVNSYYTAFHADKDQITTGLSTPKKTNAYGVRCCVDKKY